MKDNQYLEECSELLEWAAARLLERDRPRDSVPCLEYTARDGTVVIITLRDHHHGDTA